MISPELVLVDPELAALCRPLWSPPRESPPIASRDVALAPAKRRTGARRGLLRLSIAGNLVLLLMVADSRSGDVPQLVAPAPLRPPYTSSVARPSEAVMTAAQKRVLASLGRNATLRRQFVDPSTGLPRTGVSARCRPRADAPNELSNLVCAVQGQLGPRHVTSTVRYQKLPNGRYSIFLQGPGHAAR